MSKIILIIIVVFLQGCVEKPVKSEYYHYCNIEKTNNSSNGSDNPNIVSYEDVYVHKLNEWDIMITWAENGYSDTKVFSIKDVEINCYNE